MNTARNDAAAVAGDGPPGFAERLHTARLLGADASLVLHGGGNVSVKCEAPDPLGGGTLPAMFVKASGAGLARLGHDGLTGYDLGRVQRLAALGLDDDVAMAGRLRLCQLDAHAPAGSVETLLHAVLPAAYVDHTHADAVLALCNRDGGEAFVREALGTDVAIVPYVRPGALLAPAVRAALAAAPDARALVLMHHGLVTWGATARASYEAHLELVARAQAALARHARGAAVAVLASDAGERAAARALALVPALRGVSAAADPDDAARRVRRVALVDGSLEALAALARPGARADAESAPLTSDHVVRTGPRPLWLDLPDDPAAWRAEARAAFDGYASWYAGYLARHAAEPPAEADARPRVVLVPGVGIVGLGEDATAAGVACDLARHALTTMARVAASGGTWRGAGERHVFEAEFHPLQRRKVDAVRAPLAGHVACVTGAAGAIGAGVCRGLLAAGGHVLATDVDAARLAALVDELRAHFGARIVGAPVDVTDTASVAAGFDAAVRAFGGVDLVVANAGVAHVAGLDELDLETFHRLSRINVDGTLLVLAEAARRFAAQGSGGDIVLVSTKNVFAPGARFGAYSATKAAAHQLARIASLELAPHDVRVNMVAPDAVFSDGARRSGLWAEVGPDRMKARGLDEAGLEEYYRKRNLLGARVTAEHVAHAVLYFATRRSPTTGATIPVDGGLPDATPR